MKSIENATPEQLLSMVKPISTQAQSDAKCLELIGLCHESKPEPTRILQAALELANGLRKAEYDRWIDAMKEYGFEPRTALSRKETLWDFSEWRHKRIQAGN